jgi:type I restriction enzyme S subunit
VRFEEGDVLYGRMRPYLNKVWLADRSGLCSGEFIVFPNGGTLRGRFLKYRLNAQDFVTFSDRATTGDRPRADFCDFGKFPILIPPLAEQERIADRIDELFTDLSAGVTALERVKRNLSRYRAAVLHAAVTGRLTEAWRKEHGPAAKPGPKLLERILAERRRQWEQRTLAKYEKDGKQPPKNWRSRYSEPLPPKGSTNGQDLPKLPEGWCWASVGQLVIEDLCNGISIKGSDVPPGFPALKLSAMSNHGFNYADIRYIPIDNKTAHANLVHEGDFFASRGNGSLHLLARGTVAQMPPHPVVFPDTMIRLRLCDGARWVPVIWPSRLIRSQIERRAKTTAGINKVSQSDLASLAVPLPCLLEQIAISDAINEKFSQIDALEAEIEQGLARASRLRQAILKAAFEGKLVPQDPNDEPASVLLERIRSQVASTVSRRSRASRKRSPRKGVAR